MLLGVFILQHSAMKRLQLKERLQNAKLGHLERSLYVGSTNICLLVLINFWSTSSSMLWQLDFDIRIFSWVHCLSWGLIYCSALLLDLPELLGLRQIAEHCQLSQVVENDPSLSRLYSHMRHPSFSAFALILVVRPTMTLDRYLERDFPLLMICNFQGSAGYCPDQLHVPGMESRPRGPQISESSMAEEESNPERFMIGPSKPKFIHVARLKN